MASNRGGGKLKSKAAAVAKAKSSQLLDQYRESVGDTYTNGPARIGAFTGNQASQGQYPLTRFTQQYMTLLAMYRSHWIVRRVIDVVAEDMLKNAPILNCDLNPKLIKKFDKVLRDTATIAKMIVGVKWGRLFGGGVGIICIRGHDDLSKPLKLGDVDIDSYRGLIILDRWSGVFPNPGLVSDMDYPLEFGLPESYVCTMQNAVINVHHTRVIRFSGRPLPEWEKQTEMYWGLSEVEVIFDELQKRDFTSWNVVSLVARAQLIFMKDEQLAQKQSGASMSNDAYNQYLMKMAAQAEAMNNQGLGIVGKDGGVEQIAYSFGGISDVLGMQAADIAGAAEISMSRLYGRNTSGLGSNGEGDLQIYYDSIETKRHNEVDPAMDKLLPIIAMSTFGKVPDDFDYSWPAIRTMTNKERAELAKDTSGAVKELYEADLLTKREARMEIKQASDQNGLGSNLTDEAIAATPDKYASESGGGELDIPEDDDGEALTGAGAKGSEGREPQTEEEEGENGKIPKLTPKAKSKAAIDSLYDRVIETLRGAWPKKLARDAEFKEADHPRSDDGKFGNKHGGAAPAAATTMPASMAGIGKTKKHANQWVLEQMLTGKFTDKEIEQGVKHLYGAKTAPALIVWAKKQTPAAKAKQAEVQAGVKKNDESIAKVGASLSNMSEEQLAKVSAEADAELTKAEKSGHKTMYVHAKNSAGKSVYFKLSDLPEGVANLIDVTKLMKKEGYTVSVTSPWDASKPAPPNVAPITANSAHVKQISDEKYAAAQKEAEAKKPITVVDELSPAIQQSIKHYTNGSYASLNAQLRKGQPLTNAQAKLAADLDIALKKSKLTKDTVVYRKMSNPIEFLGPNPTIGTVLIDNGFISTSKKPIVWSGNVHMIISCKKDASAIDVQALSMHPGESEVLLPRGALFEIKSITKKGSNDTEVHVEYLG